MRGRVQSTTFRMKRSPEILPRCRKTISTSPGLARFASRIAKEIAGSSYGISRGLDAKGGEEEGFDKSAAFEVGAGDEGFAASLTWGGFRPGCVSDVTGCDGWDVMALPPFDVWVTPTWFLTAAKTISKASV
jgi:hypothetical protein